jgi:hypothetical protein
MRCVREQEKQKKLRERGGELEETLKALHNSG